MPCVYGASKVFVVRFRDLERWDVSFFQAVPWRWSDDVIREIGDALDRKQIEVNENEPRREIPIIGKISFGWRITVTEPDAREGYKGRLFWAESGDLIYSKIRVKQGSMGIVPPDIEI